MLQIVDEAAYSKTSRSFEKVTDAAVDILILYTSLMHLFRYEDDMKQYEDAVQRQRFKKEAKNLFSAPKSKQEDSLGLSIHDSLIPPVRPALRLIPSWESVLCTLEARLLTEFMKLEKW
jgi:hypothetical protein